MRSRAARGGTDEDVALRPASGRSRPIARLLHRPGLRGRRPRPRDLVGPPDHAQAARRRVRHHRARPRFDPRWRRNLHRPQSLRHQGRIHGRHPRRARRSGHRRRRALITGRLGGLSNHIDHRSRRQPHRVGPVADRARGRSLGDRLGQTNREPAATAGPAGPPRGWPRQAGRRASPPGRGEQGRRPPAPRGTQRRRRR